MARPSADGRSTSTKRVPRLNAQVAVEAVADATAEIAVAEAAAVAGGATVTREDSPHKTWRKPRSPGCGPYRRVVHCARKLWQCALLPSQCAFATVGFCVLAFDSAAIFTLMLLPLPM